MLYSELRTIYETTVSNPHTFRVSIKMKDMIDMNILRKSVDKTMKRYPYFLVKLKIENETVDFEKNDNEMPILNQEKPIVLASKESNYHLLAFCYWKNIIQIEIYHALTDGGGIYELIKTLLYYYCSEYYEKELSFEKIHLEGEKILEQEFIDPAIDLNYENIDLSVEKFNGNAFQLVSGGKINLTEDCKCYNIRIPENEFMRFNISNDGSPGTIIALLVARAIEKYHQNTKDPIVISMCVNQRKALKAPLAHQSLVGDVRIVYGDRIKKLPFSTQATCFRGMVTLQSDSDVVLEELKGYKNTIDELSKLSTNKEKHKYCVDLMNQTTKSMTATVSYVGKASFGDAEKYIQEFHVMPSTALPSSATPLTLELSAVNGNFYVNFMQYFDEDLYFDAFVRELRENNINYDVLYLTHANYPGMENIWKD